MSKIYIPTAQMVELSTIKPCKRNTKKHPQVQIDNIAESIRQFGFVQPIVLDGSKDNEIIIGHGRYFAAKQLKMKAVPCVYVQDLTDEQIRKLRILDNKLNESEWDIDILKLELDDLDFGEFTGVEFNINFDVTSQEIVEDNAPDVDEENEPITKLGDIWQLGKHWLMCGDSTNKTTVEKLMNGNKADMVFTDPPYGYQYQSNMRTKSPKFDVLKNDDKILDFMPVIKNVLRGFLFICTTWKVLNDWLPLFSKYYDLSNMIIWNKGGGGLAI